SPERKSLWFLCCGLAVLLIYTQVFGVFLLAALWLAVLPSRLPQLGVWRILLSNLALGIASLPLAYVMLTEDKGQLLWIPPGRLKGIWEVFRNIIGTDILSSQYWLAIAVLTALYVASWIVAVGSVSQPGDAGTTKSSDRIAVLVLAWSLVFPLVL